MSPWKQLLLTLYYQASMPVRWWNHCVAVAAERVPVAILYYHRVAGDRKTPWTLSPQAFERQIRWLQRRFEMISLAEAQRRVRSGANYRPAVSITFDDGYADNCQHAIPLLVKERIPCTYFVTLRNILEGEPFSHDLVLGHSLTPNTLDQVRAMADAGIEIGGHAYTHADLGAIEDRRLLHFEIADAGFQLQQLLGRSIRYFAFPFGQRTNLSQTACQIAQQAGYQGVCSAYGGYNFPGGDGFHLQRIPADSYMIRLKNWMTVDPRKAKIHSFQFRDATNRPTSNVRPRTEAQRPASFEHCPVVQDSGESASQPVSQE